MSVVIQGTGIVMKGMSFVCMLVVASLSFAWNAPPVAAQTLADGLGGFTQDSDEPIAIEADNLEVLDAENLAIFTGNVLVTQGTATLNTQTLRVHYQGGDESSVGPSSNQSLRLLEAIGAVEISSEDQFASGDRAEFDFVTEQIVMTGDVLLRQGGNVVRGQRLTVDLTTRESRLDAAATSSGSGRVTGVLIPGAGQ
ncbi:MAG: lipopolysaccharide transport periplasmic protein LptA [Pseudomonadota bacterium]